MFDSYLALRDTRMTSMNGTVDFSSWGDGVSRWRRVADDLRSRIAEGDISEIVPPETVLAARYGVNRHTVRRAIASLSDEGILKAERGKGTFVHRRPRRVLYPIGARTRFSENMVRQSLEPAGRIVRSALVPADDAISARLKCAVGAPLHRLDRLSVADRVPMSRSTSWFSAERFPDIIEAYAETGSITEALRRSGLSDYRRAETRITAERVSADDAELLSCAPDAIILISRAVDVDPEGQPIQFVCTRFLADRVELMFG
jgi:GntR family phosphonate transport system transcriptional regulator